MMNEETAREGAQEHARVVKRLARTLAPPTQQLPKRLKGL
jgi:hypothetical protein